MMIKKLAKSWTPKWDRIKSFYDAHQSLLILLLLFTTTRVLAVPFLRPGGFFNSFLSDTVHYWSQARWSAAGAYPYSDYWQEYPPLFPQLSVFAYRASLLFPPWKDAVVWFSLAYHALLLPFDVGCLVLIYALARRLHNAAVSLRCAVIYACLFVPFFVFLGYFDSMPLFFLLLGLYALLRGWPEWVGIATGLGIMSKLIPIVNLPAAWGHSRSWPERVRLVLSTVLAMSIVGLPVLLDNPLMTWSSLRCMLSRASYESVWAILEGYHGFGLVSYSRFDPSAAEWQAHTTKLPYGWIMLGSAILFIALYLSWIDRQIPRRTIAFAGLTLTWLMLWSKGFSPQWMVYQVPFVLLLMPGLRGVAYLISLDIITMTEWVLAYSWMGAHTWFIDGEVILHTALVVALGAEYVAAALWKPGRWVKIVQGAALAVLALTFVGQGTLLALGAHASMQDHANNEPHMALVETIRSQARKGSGVVFPQLPIFERLYPLMKGIDLHWAANLGNDAQAWQTPQLIKFGDTHPDLWFVTDMGGPEPERGLEIEYWLCERYGKESTQWIGSARVTRFVTGCPSIVQSRSVRFGDGLMLEEVGVFDTGEQALCVRLDWRSQIDLREDYIIFIHLVDDAGRWLAQNDQPPLAGLVPTSQWEAGTRVQDLHGLIVGEPLPPGSYRLLLGAYKADGTRLPAFDEAGESIGTQFTLAELFVQDERWEIRLLP
jgi:hypothetical protein